MNVATEVSLYPLSPDYEEPIIEFIKRLRSTPGIRVATNNLSTQISGDYDTVMDALKEAMRPNLRGEITCSFVLKILNVEVEPGTAVEV